MFEILPNAFSEPNAGCVPSLTSQIAWIQLCPVYKLDVKFLNFTTSVNLGH